MIIGITGGTGCGKTTLLQLIGELGGTILDCDAIYHTLLHTDRRMLAAIEMQFPGTVRDGSLDRKALGKIVFSDPDALKKLNSITHGAVKNAVTQRLTPVPRLAGIDAISLFESGISELCQLTVAISAPEEVRIQRLMQRDNISRDYALARIRAQRPAADFARMCDYHLVNDGTPEQFREKCLAFLSDLGIMKEE